VVWQEITGRSRQPRAGRCRTYAPRPGLETPSARHRPQQSHPQASGAGRKQEKNPLKSSQELGVFPPKNIMAASHGIDAFLHATSPPLGRGAGRRQRRRGEEAGALPAGREGRQDPPPKPASPPPKSLPRTPSPAEGREQKRTAPLVWDSDLRFRDKQGVRQPCPGPLRRWPWRREADPAPPR